MSEYKLDWNSLSLFEQLSNIAGEVKRCVDSRIRFKQGSSKKDYSDFYRNKVRELVDRSAADPKNRERARELYDEVHELDRFLSGEADAEYVLRYWDQYTRALALMHHQSH